VKPHWDRYSPFQREIRLSVLKYIYGDDPNNPIGFYYLERFGP
jgi:hypothetical protein